MRNLGSSLLFSLGVAASTPDKLSVYCEKPGAIAFAFSNGKAPKKNSSEYLYRSKRNSFHLFSLAKKSQAHN